MEPLAGLIPLRIYLLTAAQAAHKVLVIPAAAAVAQQAMLQQEELADRHLLLLLQVVQEEQQEEQQLPHLSQEAQAVSVQAVTRLQRLQQQLLAGQGQADLEDQYLTARAAAVLVS
jgi:hypothetical protein